MAAPLVRNGAAIAEGLRKELGSRAGQRLSTSLPLMRLPATG